MRLGNRWLKGTLLGMTGAAVAAAGVARVAAVRWNAATDRSRDRLRADARAVPAPARPADELERLPPVVARYFQTVLPPGRAPITHARIRWTGEFNMGTPNRDWWVPFTAEQDFYPGAPGMVWDARMSIAPGIAVRVRDGFVGGAGSMYGAILGVIPVVDVRDTPAMATAALQRYLAEAMWLPTALLPSQGVVWTGSSDTAALATLRAGETAASVEFRFAEDGFVDSVFVPDRLYDDGRGAPQPRPWRGRNLSYERREGLLVPAEAVVEWMLPERTYAYWRGRPLSIEYEYARR